MEHGIKSQQRSVLGTLRSTLPHHRVTFAQAKNIAERQANRLLAMFDITSGAVPAEIVSDLPRIKVVYEALPMSGLSYWSGKEWIIALNRREGHRRQRFTLMHEFKHIIDHGHTARLYTGDRLRSPSEQAEAVADYFAGCVLLPKRFLKTAWGNGIQSPLRLADHFDVSALAASVRLAQTGLRTIQDQFTEPVREFVNYGRRGFNQPQYRTEIVGDGS